VGPVPPGDRVEINAPAWTLDNTIHRSWMSQIVQISLKLTRLFPR